VGVGTQAAIAALPIALILVMMLGLRWSAARAGLIGAVVAVLLARGVFGYGITVHPELGPTRAVVGASAEAGFTALAILLIIFPALCIYQLQSRTGAIETLRRSIGRVSSDPIILAILVAWFFALFLEGAAGFGTPVALAAPFLVSAGFDRVQAVTIVMVGHAVGVSFGAVGTPVLPQVAVTAIPGAEIARATGIYHALLGGVMLLFLVWFARRGLPAAARGDLAWKWITAAGGCFLLPFFALSRWVGPELPTLAGALFGGVAFVVALRAARPGGGGEPARKLSALRALRVAHASAPYLVLVALILVSRLLPPLRETLTAVEVSWELWGAFQGTLLPLYHPGTMLLLGFLLGALLQGASRRVVGTAMRAAFGQLGLVTVALVAMLLLSRVLVHAGMIDVMAAAAASGLGAAWPLFAPLVGVLGTFVTGSATASNILFTDFQRATAEELGLSVLAMLGIQGFGAAVGNIICPHNIIAGGATVGLAGREGEVLRKTLVPCMVYALLGGALALLLVAGNNTLG
jgi:lactate permease